MKKLPNTCRKAHRLIDKVLDLTEQIYLLRCQINEMENKLDMTSVDFNTIGLEKPGVGGSSGETISVDGFCDVRMDNAEAVFTPKIDDSGTATNSGYRKDPRIIPFSGKTYTVSSGACTEENNVSVPVNAGPGMFLPSYFYDYRPLLQRDGLILLAWDKRLTERGERFTAYWVTSTGAPRFYASNGLSQDLFSLAQPERKSYAAEDGIDYYGQEKPFFIIHVAPELMMSNPGHRDLRQTHIETLKKLGCRTDFEYEYLLTKERKRRLPGYGKSRDASAKKTG